MRAGGCLLVLLGLVGLVGTELWAFLTLVELFDREYFGTLLLLVVLSAVGVGLLRWRMRGLLQATLGGANFGTQAVAILGCILLIVPGFITGLIGLLVQLPFIGRLFGRFAGVIVAAGLRQYAARMGGQVPPGFPPGGMPTAGKRPGPTGLKADQRLQGKRIFDVDAER
jgi:UPF0716 family protein affecting phage T7 exclusion